MIRVFLPFAVKHPERIREEPRTHFRRIPLEFGRSLLRPGREGGNRQCNRGGLPNADHRA